MSIFINIVLILISLVLIVVVLMQEGNKQGLGAIGGAAETFLGKSKSKGVEGKLLLITKIAAAAFVALAILATWMSSRTYEVRYYVENEEIGAVEEYFPYAETMLYMQQLTGGTMTADEINALPAEQKRLAYAEGDEIIAYQPPYREGYEGKWDKELPAKMGRKNYELNAIYTIGQYTLTVQAGVDPTIVVATDSEPAAPEVYFTATATYGEPVDLSSVPALPAAPEGYTVAWSQELPTTMPGADTVIDVVYSPIIVEEATAAEATEAEAAPVEPVEETTEDASPAEAE